MWRFGNVRPKPHFQINRPTKVAVAGILHLTKPYSCSLRANEARRSFSPRSAPALKPRRATTRQGIHSGRRSSTARSHQAVGRSPPIPLTECASCPDSTRHRGRFRAPRPTCRCAHALYTDRLTFVSRLKHQACTGCARPLDVRRPWDAVMLQTRNVAAQQTLPARSLQMRQTG